MPVPNHWIVTGQFTDTGGVAWRRSDGTWSQAIADAGLFDDEASAKQVAATALATEQRHVSDPYAIEVHANRDAGSLAIDPLTARQRIRANGPTIRLRRPD